MDRIIYNDLLNVFRLSQGKQPDSLAAEVIGCNLPEPLKHALREAILGDNRPLNEWLFSEGVKPDEHIVWIAPVQSEKPAYVWMFGQQNRTSLDVHSWFTQNRLSLRQDPLLNQALIPPNLLFVDTYAVSSIPTTIFGHDDEFAIFQVAYKNTPVEVTDLNQRMVLNTRLAVWKRELALARMEACCLLDNTTLTCLSQHLELFAIIHNEGHNQGHFVGAWPFEEVVKKRCMQYEAVEEFRACLASIVMAEHLHLTQSQRDSYALGVFMTRFFGFGFEAYCLPKQSRETIREITVGLMFFEWLRANSVVYFDGKTLTIDAPRVRPSLIAAYRFIFEQEQGMDKNGQTDLLKTARLWYQMAFPNSQYSQIARIVYDSMRESVTKVA